ncbi:MAG TPA: branched-chain-amino-acid transaminase [Candidatus Omnitrophota bacterium]|jgi:branched-chain amino acid aminotransferase|nr:MAG: Branched-chain-amino-acid aminotransferase [Candidatus Omnitrophica bacterium ADurb.Bin314]HOE68065.1 branched-chain-amino-acid transaminase [Candidatus Omnitrophota bacterium]HPW64782.1 branched-chain-amino-acid transaminase [Candidatus Omnitrophota bacterium]HQB94338.1 branched-chain-amino-acid transaminase [Candidatus Omnitrophota bacterium]
MELQIYIDGKWYPRSEAKVSVFDHGLLYGDGVFEGIRAYDGIVFKLEEHLKRLWESAHTIMLEIPMTPREMEKAVIETLRRNKLTSGYIRLVVTRGTGDLGLSPFLCKKPTVFIITDKIALYPADLYQKGLEIITVPTVRNLPEAVNPSIKSLNYLNNIMAKIEARNGGCMEALMLNHQGYVVECTGDNVFMVKKTGKGSAVKDCTLLTPPSYLGALKGITRDAIIEIARKLKLPFAERILTRHDFFNADEVFLTGTAAEVIPVVKIDGRVVGSGKPGKITKLLLEDFHALVRKDGVRFSL